MLLPEIFLAKLFHSIFLLHNIFRYKSYWSGIDTLYLNFRAMKVSRDFFALPEEKKEAIAKQPIIEQGYVRPGQEIFDTREDWKAVRNILRLPLKTWWGQCLENNLNLTDLTSLEGIKQSKLVAGNRFSVLQRSGAIILWRGGKSDRYQCDKDGYAPCQKIWVGRSRVWISVHELFFTETSEISRTVYWHHLALEIVKHV